jgi:hypothetical protein
MKSSIAAKATAKTKIKYKINNNQNLVTFEKETQTEKS